VKTGYEIAVCKKFVVNVAREGTSMPRCNETFGDFVLEIGKLLLINTID
jgi:hypothetical protein